MSTVRPPSAGAEPPLEREFDIRSPLPQPNHLPPPRPRLRVQPAVLAVTGQSQPQLTTNDRPFPLPLLPGCGIVIPRDTSLTNVRRMRVGIVYDPGRCGEAEANGTAGMLVHRKRRAYCITLTLCQEKACGFAATAFTVHYC